MNRKYASTNVGGKAREPELLSGIVRQVIEGFENSDMKQIGKIFARWKELVGHPLSLHTLPYKVSRKKLLVLVDSSSWLYEIRTQWKDEILQRVQALVGKDLVKDVVFRVGDLDGSTPS